MVASDSFVDDFNLRRATNSIKVTYREGKRIKREAVANSGAKKERD